MQRAYRGRLEAGSEPVVVLVVGQGVPERHGLAREADVGHGHAELALRDRPDAALVLQAGHLFSPAPRRAAAAVREVGPQARDVARAPVEVQGVHLLLVELVAQRGANLAQRPELPGDLAQLERELLLGVLELLQHLVEVALHAVHLDEHVELCHVLAPGKNLPDLVGAHEGVGELREVHAPHGVLLPALVLPGLDRADDGARLAAHNDAGLLQLLRGEALDEPLQELLLVGRGLELRLPVLITVGVPRLLYVGVEVLELVDLLHETLLALALDGLDALLPVLDQRRLRALRDDDVPVLEATSLGQPVRLLGLPGFYAAPVPVCDEAPRVVVDRQGLAGLGDAHRLVSVPVKGDGVVAVELGAARHRELRRRGLLGDVPRLLGHLVAVQQPRLREGRAPGRVQPVQRGHAGPAEPAAARRRPEGGQRLARAEGAGLGRRAGGAGNRRRDPMSRLVTISQQPRSPVQPIMGDWLFRTC